MTTLWPLSLIAVFAIGLIGAMWTGDVRWLLLCVVPGVVFAKWWRVT